MADSYIGIDEPSTIDKKADTEQLTVGANTVERERIEVAGAAAAEIARVINAAPTTEYGLVTRNIPSGTQPISAASLPLPTGASTLAEQQIQTTALQLIDDVVHALNAALVKAVAIAGQLDDTTPTAATEDNVAPLRITAQRAAHVNLRDVSGTEIGTVGAPVRTDPIGTTTQPVSGTVTANLAAGTNNIGDVDVLSVVPGTGAPNLGKAIDSAAGATDTGVAPLAVRDDALAALTPVEGDYVPLRTDANGALWTHDDALDAALAGSELQVDLVAALPAGTNNIGDVDVLTLPALPAGTNNIGDVDVLSLPALPAGTNNIGDVDIVTMPNVTLAAGTNTNEVVGDAAHDAAAAGNPLLVGAYAETPDDTAPGNQVSAEADVVRLAADRDGALYTHPHPPRIWHASNEYTTQQTDASVKAAPGVGLSLYITDIYLACNAAVTVTLEEGTTTLKWRYYASGQGDGVALSLTTPIKLTANTALTVTTSGAVTVTLVVTGYTAP